MLFFNKIVTSNGYLRSWNRGKDALCLVLNTKSLRGNKIGINNRFYFMGMTHRIINIALMTLMPFVDSQNIAWLAHRHLIFEDIFTTIFPGGSGVKYGS